MNLKSTLQVFNEADLKASKVDQGQTRKVFVGNDERPSERLRVHLRSFKPGTHVPLHWHPIEALYYVISGRAVMTDIEGKSYDIRPGSVIYYPAGIAGSHQWDIKEGLQLITFRATTDSVKLLQFRVDKSTKESSIELNRLIRHEAVQFKSLY